jgi:outer membrane immunogenic protein
MRHLQSVLVAAVAAVGFAAVASAADMPVKAPVYKAPVAIAPSWTGFYVGANGGGGWSHSDFGYIANDPSSALLFAAGTGGRPPSDTLKSSGWLGGLQLGYNWQFSRQWLVGLEADFDFSDVRGSATGPAQIVAARPVTATLDDQLKDFGTVRARLGYLPTNNLLVYATGGAAYAKIDRHGDYTMTSGGGIGSVTPPVTFVCFAGRSCFNGGTDSWVAGWTAGAGLEYAFAAHWTVKAEYLHASLESKSITETATAPFAGNPCCSAFNANFGRTNLDIVRGGVNYRF